jgi:hypothetical protein
MAGAEVTRAIPVYTTIEYRKWLPVPLLRHSRSTPGGTGYQPVSGGNLPPESACKSCTGIIPGSSRAEGRALVWRTLGRIGTPPKQAGSLFHPDKRRRCEEICRAPAVLFFRISLYLAWGNGLEQPVTCGTSHI